MPDTETLEIGEDKSILLLDDDEPFLRRLAKAMEKRGFEVETAGSVTADVQSPRRARRLCRGRPAP